MFTLTHVDGNGSDFFNTMILYLSKFSNIYTKTGITTWIHFFVIFIFFYLCYRILTDKNSFDDIIKYFYTNFYNNILTKMLLVILGLGFLLSPIPLIQVTPVVQKNVVTKQYILKGWTVNDRKTIIDKDNNTIAFVPLIIAAPLTLLEKFFYGIPFNFAEEKDIIVPDSDRSMYSVTTFGTFNKSFPYTLTNCIGGDYNGLGGFIEIDKIPESCYVAVDKNSILNSDLQVAGDMFQSYFATVEKTKDIINSNITILDSAQDHSTTLTYKNSLNAELKNKLTKDDTNIIKTRILNYYNDYLNNLVFRIKNLTKKVKDVNDNYSSANYIQSLNNAFLRELSLNNQYDYIVGSNEFYVEDSEINNFINERNTLYEKYKDSEGNGKKGIYFNEEIDTDLTGKITTDKYINKNYASNIDNVKFYLDNDKIQIKLDYDIITDSLGKTNSEFIDNDGLVDNVGNEFKIKFMENLSTISSKLNPNIVKHINISEIKNILQNEFGDNLSENDIDDFLNNMKDIEQYYVYYYYLSMLNDYVSSKEKEYNDFLSVYIKDNIEKITNDSVVFKFVSDSQKENNLIEVASKINKDLTENGNVIFGFALDNYSKLKKENNNWVEDEYNLNGIMLKRVSSDDLILSKMITKDDAGNNVFGYTEKYSLDKPYNYPYISVSDFDSYFSKLNENEDTLLNDKTFNLFNTNKDVSVVFGKKNIFDGKEIFNTSEVNCNFQGDNSEDFCNSVNDYVKKLNENVDKTLPIPFDFINDIVYSYSNIFSIVNKEVKQDQDLINSVRKKKILLSGLILNKYKENFNIKMATFNILKYGQDLLEVNSGNISFKKEILDEINKNLDNLNDNIDSYYQKQLGNDNSMGVNIGSEEDYKTRIKDDFKSISDALNGTTDLETQTKEIIKYVALKTYYKDLNFMGDLYNENSLSDNKGEGELLLSLGKPLKQKDFSPVIFNMFYYLLQQGMDAIKTFQNVLIIKESGNYTTLGSGININLIVGDTYVNLNNGSTLMSKNKWSKVYDSSGLKGVGLKLKNDLLSLLGNTDINVLNIVKVIIELISIIMVSSITFSIIFLVILITILQVFGYFYVIGMIPLLILWSLMLTGLPNKPEDFQIKPIVIRGIKLMGVWLIWYIFTFAMLLFYKYGILYIQQDMMMSSFISLLQNGSNVWQLTKSYFSIVVLPLGIYLIVLLFSYNKFKSAMSDFGRESFKEIISDNYTKSINVIHNLSTLTKNKK